MLGLIFLLAACQKEQATPVPSPTQTATITLRPTGTPTSTFTPLPTATHTQAPSPTPLPSWCPAKTPARTLSTGKLRIAFVSGSYAPSQDACLWTEGEGQIRLSHAGYVDQIALSDDGQFVAFTRLMEAGRAELWSIRSDGSDEKLLVTPDQFARMRQASSSEIVIAMDLHWVPGTHMIAFHTNLAATFSGFFYSPDDLWWVDAETGSVVEKPVVGEIFYSPDGRWAAVVNQEHLVLMNKDGTGQRIIELENYHTLPMGVTYNEPPRVDWAGDSRSLFVSIVDTWNPIEAEEAMVAIWQVNVDGTPAMKIGKFKGYYPSFAYSPDHQFITYFCWLEHGPNRRQLYLTTLDRPEELVVHDEDYTGGAIWSPDSQAFIFWANDKPYLGHICQEPIALFDRPVEDYSGDDVWVNDSEYILVVDSATILHYLGWIDPPGQPLRKLFGGVETFDWTWVQ